MATLLSLVMALIIAAQQPNIPPELRVQALQVASVAIQYVNTHPDTAPIVGAVDAAAAERALRDARALQNEKDIAAQEAKVAKVKADKIVALKKQIAEYDYQLADIEGQRMQVNADYAKKGTGVTAFETEMWNNALRDLAAKRIPIVRAQAPLLIELESLR